jgi:hypothetical protein
MNIRLDRPAPCSEMKHLGFLHQRHLLPNAQFFKGHFFESERGDGLHYGLLIRHAAGAVFGPAQVDASCGMICDGHMILGGSTPTAAQ